VAAKGWARWRAGGGGVGGGEGGGGVSGGGGAPPPHTHPTGGAYPSCSENRGTR